MTSEEVIKSLFEALKPVQKDMFKKFFQTSNRKFVIHSSRRLGKTHLLCVIAACVALSKPNAQVRYATFTQKGLRKMVLPIFKQLFLTIPGKFRPTFNTQDGSYLFSNGSQIHLSGVNNGRSDTLRGTSADLALIDEAGFVDELSYLTESVLMPQLLTVHNSKLIMASSSPISPAHEFVDYIGQSRLGGFYASYTIYDAGYEPDLVEEFCLEAGGKDSTTWKREYLNEIIVDSQYAIVPEFSKDLIQPYIPTVLDQYYHRYVSMDIGTKDFTAILFGVYDFKQATLFIQDEIIINGPDVTTANIAKLVKEKEKKAPYRRIADNNNLILLQDLGSEFNLHFAPTNKDKLEAMVNELRLWVTNKRIVVDPKCLQTIGSLEFGVWNKDRKDWAKSKQYGHFDALASLMYMVRNIDQHSNPIPSTHGTTEFTHYTPFQEDSSHEQLRKIFGL